VGIVYGPITRAREAYGHDHEGLDVLAAGVRMVLGVAAELGEALVLQASFDAGAQCLVVVAYVLRVDL
jgi:hypothetical protein